MITENLSTLKIHKLSQEQYNRELAAGRLDETALYLTPEETIDFSVYATVAQLNDKINTDNLIHESFGAAVAELSELVGIEKVETQISNAIKDKADKADLEHTHPELELAAGAVLFTSAQELDAYEQEQARANIGALPVDAVILSEKVAHGAEYLNNIIEAYILNIDYSALLAFDTTEVIVGSYDSGTTSMLGQAILGKMILA